MTQNLYKDAESVLRDNYEIYLATLEKTFSQELRLYKRQSDIYSDVYGASSGHSLEDYQLINGIVVGDDFKVIDSRSRGFLQAGFLYTSSKLPDTGDSIGIVGVDDKLRLYKIGSKNSLGMTEDVFIRFDLTSMEDK